MPPLMNTDQDRSGWLSVEAAADRLGVSVATVKRRIHDGKPVRVAGNRSVEIEAEQVSRPQGHEWQVRIRTALPPIRSDHERSDSEEQTPIRSVQDDSGALSALRDLLEADRETIAEKDAQLATSVERIIDLSRQLGEATTRADMLQAERNDLAAELVRIREKAERPWWRFWD